MKITLETRFWSFPQPSNLPSVDDDISIIMCTPWNTYRSSVPDTLRIPLLRRYPHLWC